MAKKSKTEKFMDAQIEGFYYKHVNGRQIGVMDIGKVFKAGREAFPSGLPAVEAAVMAAMEIYCTTA